MSFHQLIANGLRRAHRMARHEPHLHILDRFQQTPASKSPDRQWGPEFVASCRHCGAYMLVYFDDKDSLEQQGYKPEDHVLLTSEAHHHYESYMVVSGNWNRFECGKLKKS